jgi:hypothetical protein
MSTFADRMLLKLMQDGVIEDLLQNQLGLSVLFNLTYETQEVEIHDLTLARVQRRHFQMAVLETFRIIGTKERILPTPERVQINYSQLRAGRLEWVEVFLEVVLAAKVEQTSSSVEAIIVKNLIEELGGVNSFGELRNKLEARYSASFVDTFFQKLQITNLEDFKAKGYLFLETVTQTPPIFDPNDPKNSRNFSVNICCKFQSELNVTEALQAAQLCRSILENEHNFQSSFAEGEVKRPYVFVTIFPDSAAVDNAIPGLNATQIKQGVQALFAAEEMLAHFFPGV